jgi:outer membrane protein TolC
MKLFLMILFTSLSAHAADLSLADVENRALEKSPEIRTMKLQKESASWGETKALSRYIPHLDLKGSHAWETKFQELEVEFGGAQFAMPAVAPYTILQAEASWMVFDGFSAWNQYQAARLETKARDLELSRATLKLRAGIRTKFYQALGAQALQKVADENIKTLEQHISDANSQFRQGVSTKYDILRIEVQLEEARTEKMSADDNVAVSRARLFEALGVPDEAQTFQGTLPDKWETQKFHDLKLAVNDREDRQAQILREEAASNLSSASKGAYFPQVSLYATKDWYNNINSSFNENFKDAYSMGVSFRWNLFDGGATLASQKQAALASQESSERLRALNDRIPVEFEAWKRKLNLSIASYQARLSAIKKAEESVRLAKNGIRAGIRTNTEVLDAEMDLNLARARAVRSQIDAVEALGELESATGQSLMN